MERLDEVVSQGPQPFQLCGVLDSFGDAAQPERVREGDHRGRQGSARRPGVISAAD